MNPKSFVALLFLCLSTVVFAQKKPLDHTVYDGWQSLSETTISNDGRYVSYMVLPQEGDGVLYIQKIDGDTLTRVLRGYEGAFLPNSSYFVCKIKPTFKQTRQAKIDKKKEDEMPTDSLAIVNLSTGTVQKIARVKSFQVSEKEGSLLAWLDEKAVPNKQPKLDSLAQLNKLQSEADSLSHVADSLRTQVAQAKTKGLQILKPQPKKDKKTTIKPDGTDLHIWNLQTNDSLVLHNITDYTISAKNNIVAVAYGSTETDSIKKIGYVQNNKILIVLQNIKEIKALTLDEEGKQLAFMADKDSTAKALRNYYSLYLFKKGNDSAHVVATKNTQGIPENNQISEYAKLYFSKSGKRLFFGTSPILPLKDTSLPDFERVRLDVWHYKEDELHTVQLYNLERDLKRNYLALYDIDRQQVLQLASNTFRNVYLTENGDGKYFYTSTDSAHRVSRQWLGSANVDVYLWDLEKGQKRIIAKNWNGNVYPSYDGNGLLLYNAVKRNYSLYNVQTNAIKPVLGITVPVYDVENDVPDDPSNYGVMGWTKDGSDVFVYGQYDIWKIDAQRGTSTLVISGKANKESYQYVSLDKELRYIPTDSVLAFDKYYNNTKNNQFVLFSLDKPNSQHILTSLANYKVASLNKAKNADTWTFTKQNFQVSPNVFSLANNQTIQLSNINRQQNNYSWGTAELYKWKAYTGKETEGILYKPENFDPNKKYPLIAYFYERNNETLYNYLPPSPTPSRLNISFFVSRGYIVFVPDIWYTTGHPGQSAYNYIVSGVRSLIKKGFVDSTKMGLQGQSWGGYQTAYLIAKAPGMFAAAWAGAPVVNMFSAYGGIRWESGMNRQFQYEKTQSRIGATVWDKPNLYIENSPLFNLPKVTTPVVIMANDADGAVPWYQGIEMFTDLRRLDKPSWLLNYNGEAHNLVQRRNRKDIQIREQQFFDWLLKGEKPAPWITEGVPAIMKDKTMGL
ncbi:MAG: prolyl oligopeptidase family serine peptidase [Chitinophagaceae bacterium]